jgi:hypothetical protein
VFIPEVRAWWIDGITVAGVTADLVEFSLAAVAGADTLADELAARVIAAEADLAADVLIPAEDVRHRLR